EPTIADGNANSTPQLITPEATAPASAYNLNSSVLSKSGFTEQQLAYALSQLHGGSEAPLAKAFYEAEQNTGINALYLAAAAAQESSYGTSPFAELRNNLYGINAVDSNPDNATSFASKKACIQAFVDILNKYYLQPGNKNYRGPTLHDIYEKYSTSHDQEAAAIASIMSNLAGYAQQIPTSSNTLTTTETTPTTVTPTTTSPSETSTATAQPAPTTAVTVPAESATSTTTPEAPIYVAAQIQPDTSSSTSINSSEQATNSNQANSSQESAATALPAPAATTEAPPATAAAPQTSATKTPALATPDNIASSETTTANTPPAPTSTTPTEVSASATPTESTITSRPAPQSDAITPIVKPGPHDGVSALISNIFSSSNGNSYTSGSAASASTSSPTIDPSNTSITSSSNTP
ncbi:MAG: glucosaminidase domain-containing protein, partial [Candidatus Saccharimonadales bacterium]